MNIQEIPTTRKEKPRVCAYVRVSTDSEAQEDSFAFQSNYYMVKGKYKKSDELTEQMAEFLVKAIVKDWTITFEFQNGYKATKEYTNGREGNVNGKLCKH